jgi:hypothetical protein
LNYFRSRQLLDSGVEVIKESIRSKGLQQKILDIKVVALDNQLYTKALRKRDEGVSAGRTPANLFPDYRPSDEEIKKVPLYVVSGAHSTQALKELRNAFQYATIYQTATVELYIARDNKETHVDLRKLGSTANAVANSKTPPDYVDALWQMHTAIGQFPEGDSKSDKKEKKSLREDLIQDIMHQFKYQRATVTAMFTLAAVVGHEWDLLHRVLKGDYTPPSDDDPEAGGKKRRKKKKLSLRVQSTNVLQQWTQLPAGNMREQLLQDILNGDSKIADLARISEDIRVRCRIRDVIVEFASMTGYITGETVVVKDGAYYDWDAAPNLADDANDEGQDRKWKSLVHNYSTVAKDLLRPWLPAWRLLKGKSKSKNPEGWKTALADAFQRYSDNKKVAL